MCRATLDSFYQRLLPYKIIEYPVCDPELGMKLFKDKLINNSSCLKLGNMETLFSLRYGTSNNAEHIVMNILL